MASRNSMELPSEVPQNAVAHRALRCSPCSAVTPRLTTRAGYSSGDYSKCSGTFPKVSQFQYLFGHVRNSNFRKRTLEMGLDVKTKHVWQLPGRVPPGMLRPTKPCAALPLHHSTQGDPFVDSSEALEQGPCKCWDVL